jgi:hypothetical protein
MKLFRAFTLDWINLPAINSGIVSGMKNVNSPRIMPKNADYLIWIPAIILNSAIGIRYRDPVRQFPQFAMIKQAGPNAWKRALPFLGCWKLLSESILIAIGIEHALILIFHLLALMQFRILSVLLWTTSRASGMAQIVSNSLEITAQRLSTVLI